MNWPIFQTIYASSNKSSISFFKNNENTIKDKLYLNILGDSNLCNLYNFE